VDGFHKQIRWRSARARCWDFDRPRPPISSTLSGASMAAAAAKFGQKALNLTTASPIAPWHEVEPSDDEINSPRSHKPRSRLQVLHPSSQDHRPSTPPTSALETAATGATMENGVRASVLSDSFISAQESSLRAARETILKSRSLVASTPVPAPAPRLKGVHQLMRQTGIDSQREKSLPPLPREGANSPDILDMIRRGWEEAGLLNPNSRRRRSTGAWRSPKDGSRPPLRRQKTTIGAESRKSWVGHDKLDLSLLDDAVSLRSPKAKDGEERSAVGEGDVSLYAVEDERQGFNFSDGSLDLHTPLVCRNFRSTFQHH